jgi:pimeloyl-ACP methyl ester carboxylesterase
MNSATPRRRDSSRYLFRSIVRGLLVIAVVFAGGGAFYQSISVTRNRRMNAMPGKLVDVGGYQMHIDCAGEGSPAVILDSGLGDSYISWRKVQHPISQFVKVCSYDRAGLGYSESSPLNRTSKDIAGELHVLLHNAGIAGPLILVGHSMAGFDVRVYTSMFPSEVAGVVLVDASHPDQENRFPPALNDMNKSWIRQAEFLEFAMPFGMPRVLGFCGNDPRVMASECNFSSARESVAEMKAFSESAAQAAAAGSLRDRPLVVLSHDPDKPQPDLPDDLVKPTNDAWGKMQEELAHLSTRGTRTVAKNSSHYVQLDRPDLVIDAVRAVVEQARQTQLAATPRS